jgi:hypothetical protein
LNLNQINAKCGEALFAFRFSLAQQRAKIDDRRQSVTTQNDVMEHGTQRARSMAAWQRTL